MKYLNSGLGGANNVPNKFIYKLSKNDVLAAGFVLAGAIGTADASPDIKNAEAEALAKKNTTEFVDNTANTKNKVGNILDLTEMFEQENDTLPSVKKLGMKIDRDSDEYKEYQTKLVLKKGYTGYVNEEGNSIVDSKLKGYGGNIDAVKRNVEKDDLNEQAESFYKNDVIPNVRNMLTNYADKFLEGNKYLEQEDVQSLIDSVLTRGIAKDLYMKKYYEVFNAYKQAFADVEEERRMFLVDANTTYKRGNGDNGIKRVFENENIRQIERVQKEALQQKMFDILKKIENQKGSPLYTLLKNGKEIYEADSYDNFIERSENVSSDTSKGIEALFEKQKDLNFEINKLKKEARKDRSKLRVDGSDLKRETALKAELVQVERDIKQLGDLIDGAIDKHAKEKQEILAKDASFAMENLAKGMSQNEVIREAYKRLLDAKGVVNPEAEAGHIDFDKRDEYENYVNKIVKALGKIFNMTSKEEILKEAERRLVENRYKMEKKLQNDDTTEDGEIPQTVVDYMNDAILYNARILIIDVVNAANKNMKKDGNWMKFIPYVSSDLDKAKRGSVHSNEHFDKVTKSKEISEDRGTLNNQDKALTKEQEGYMIKTKALFKSQRETLLDSTNVNVADRMKMKYESEDYKTKKSTYDDALEALLEADKHVKQSPENSIAQKEFKKIFDKLRLETRKAHKELVASEKALNTEIDALRKEYEDKKIKAAAGIFELRKKVEKLETTRAEKQKELDAFAKGAKGSKDMIAQQKSIIEAVAKLEVELENTKRQLNEYRETVYMIEYMLHTDTKNKTNATLKETKNEVKSVAYELGAKKAEKTRYEDAYSSVLNHKNAQKLPITKLSKIALSDAEIALIAAKKTYEHALGLLNAQESEMGEIPTENGLDIAGDDTKLVKKMTEEVSKRFGELKAQQQEAKRKALIAKQKKAEELRKQKLAEQKRLDDLKRKEQDALKKKEKPVVIEKATKKVIETPEVVETPEVTSVVNTIDETKAKVSKVSGILVDSMDHALDKEIHDSFAYSLFGKLAVTHKVYDSKYENEFVLKEKRTGYSVPYVYNAASQTFTRKGTDTVYDMNAMKLQIIVEGEKRRP